MKPKETSSRTEDPTSPSTTLRSRSSGREDRPAGSTCHGCGLSATCESISLSRRWRTSSVSSSSPLLLLPPSFCSGIDTFERSSPFSQSGRPSTLTSPLNLRASGHRPRPSSVRPRPLSLKRLEPRSSSSSDDASTSSKQSSPKPPSTSPPLPKPSNSSSTQTFNSRYGATPPISLFLLEV